MMRSFWSVFPFVRRRMKMQRIYMGVEQALSK